MYLSFSRTTVKIKESKRIDTYLNLRRELKKAGEREGDGDRNCISNICKRLRKEIEITGGQRNE